MNGLPAEKRIVLLGLTDCPDRQKDRQARAQKDKTDAVVSKRSFFQSAYGIPS